MKRKRAPPKSAQRRDDAPPPVRVERMSSGIPGLDVVLDGGLVRGRVYVLSGPAGSGKTVMALQLACHRAREGGSVVYASAITEAMGTLIANASSLAFFDPALIPSRLTFLSASSALAESGLPGMLEFVGRTVREMGAELLVVDSLAGFEDLAVSPQALKRFLGDLAVLAALLDCTVLCTVPRERDELPGPERLMGDGVFALHRETKDWRSLRTFEVLKYRGSAHLDGLHVMDIDSSGVTIRPRLESLPRRAAQPVGAGARAPFGIARLDEMLEGGLVPRSITALLGGPGTGKTLLATKFLSEAAADEPALYFGFYENPERLIAKARGVRMQLEPRVRAGTLELLWQSTLEQSLDAIGETLFDAVHRRGVRRLVIDGLDGLNASASDPARVPRFFAALTADLRADGVTTIVTEETQLVEGHVLPPTQALSLLFDNIVLLRFVELHARVHRLLSILKLRESDYDSSVHELCISSRGIELAGTFDTARAVLAGEPRTDPTPGDGRTPARSRST